MTIKVRGLIRLLEREGWQLLRQPGTSHRQYRRPGSDMAIGALKEVLRKAGLKLDWEGGMEYAVMIDRAGSNWFGHVPDLPGCLATGDTVEEVRLNLREAIRAHIEALREIGAPVPEPAKIAAQVSAA